MARQLKGSCFCKTVQFELEESAIYFMGNCHCENCRKFTGAAFCTMYQVRDEGFRWTSGEENVASYQSPVGACRAFCQSCGSRLPQVQEKSSNVAIPAGAMDDDIDRLPQAEIWVDFKARWYEPAHDVPKCDGRGSPEFWSEVLGGSVKMYEDLQRKQDETAV